MGRKCFAIMPFEEGFDDIQRIVQNSAEACGLIYFRSDRREQAGSVLRQILHDIRSATVVVADISRHNPNVLYELGIAHPILGPDRVVIIRQSADKSPYDVNEYRHLVYSHNDQGRLELGQRLTEYLRKAADIRAEEESWNVVKGPLARTRLIVRDLHRLIDRAGSEGLDGVTIRCVAGLGSLAISDLEPPEPAYEDEYVEQMRAERDTLRKALLRGARLKAILLPPRRFAQAMLPDRLTARYQRFIRLLEGRSDFPQGSEAATEDIRAMQQCDFVLTPIPSPNVMIIGDSIAYEGLKRGGGPGFERTHYETDSDVLKEMIQQFDRFFENSREDMVRTHPPDGRLLQQLIDCYSDATGRAW